LLLDQLSSCGCHGQTAFGEPRWWSWTAQLDHRRRTSGTHRELPDDDRPAGERIRWPDDEPL
jgi:hypothetical protein